MSLNANPFQTLKSLKNDQRRFYYSLPALEEQNLGKISRLPVSIRIMLESVLRNCDNKKIKEEDVLRLANWNAKQPGEGEVPFIVSRVILQDFTGVPLLVDLASMRDAVAKQGKDPRNIEPLVPVDLVVDHSVQVDRARTEDSFLFNLQVEFERNQERYSFLKWGQQAFQTFQVVPPGIGIVHQVNLEHLGKIVMTLPYRENSQMLCFDTLVGTDSHTTMINGLGIVGWGVGGIEAEAAMLGQPVALQMPEVIGFHFSGELQEGVTATDMTLRVTEILRKEKVVGKFIEFFGEGAATLSVADRATIGNMAPEYGATMGFFPVDDKTLDYLRLTGRSEKDIEQIKEYLEAQKIFGIPKKGQVDYTKVIELDLSSIKPCVSGPKRPQDRIDLTNVKTQFESLLMGPISSGGYEIKAGSRPKVCIHSKGMFEINMNQDTGGKAYLSEKPYSWGEEEMVTNRPLTHAVEESEHLTETEPKVCDLMLEHGSIVIAAITSCTNTSNPAVMLGAGLLAKKAVEKGLKVNCMIKTSLAPGSRVVTDYLNKTGLQKYLDALGFNLVAYGCTTCIGNSGPLDERIENAIKEYDVVAASVLSGNRNFEARIHAAVKANFLMSPPLVVAFAIAGRVNIDMEKEPLGYDKEKKPVFLRDIWPSTQEIEDTIKEGLHPSMFKQRYAHVLEDNPVWKDISIDKGSQYDWDENSTYIQNPPYFDEFTLQPPKLKVFKDMRALAIFGDSVTTDHISPAGAFRANSPAGQYLISKGVKEEDFNSYGSRRGNHHVMMRGTFANVRIRNKMADGKEGGFTKLQPDGTLMTIFEASQKYAEKKTPLIIFAGKDYGMGSSRDWAAKGSALLGVKVVVAQSFERIHRSNLIGMGVLPLEFLNDDSAESLGISGDEVFSLVGIEEGKRIAPKQKIKLEVQRNGQKKQVELIVRIDTPIEADYFEHGGILQYVLRQQLR